VFNGGSCAVLGDTIDYTFVLQNTGDYNLSNVVLTDPLLELPNPSVPIVLVSGDANSDAILQTSETWTYTASYVITQADIDIGTVDNTAGVVALSGDGTTITSSSNAVSTVLPLCPPASISLLKSGVINDVNGNSFSDEGDTITYMFTVENTGEVPLYNISIADTDFGIIIGDDPTVNPLSPGILVMGGPLDVLLPGEVDESTFTATYTLTSSAGPFVDPSDSDGFLSRIIFNQATVSGEYEIGNPDTIVTDLSDDPNIPVDADADGDGDPDDPSKVLLANPVFTVTSSFEIFNGITPDGDGRNDFFLVKGISNWPVNNVQIFNRWGVLIFETDGYGGSNDSENVFEGISEGRTTVQQSDRLPTGTYYYIINFPGDNPGKSSYAGYLYINR
jgi:gliding motility-associated-like protein